MTSIPARVALAALMLLAATAMAFGQAAPPPIRPTLEDIFAKKNVLGSRPANAQISADGSYVSYWQSAPGAEPGERDLIVVATRGGEGTPVAHATKDKGVTASWSPTGARLAIIEGGWLSLLEPARNEPAAKVFETGEDVSGFRWLKDGERVTFLAGRDPGLWVVGTRDGRRQRLLADVAIRSGSLQLNKEATMVAVLATPREARETKTEGKESGKAKPFLHVVKLEDQSVFTRPEVTDLSRMVWSPDGAMAVLVEHESQVEREVFVADYLTELVSKVPARSSKAGDPPSEVELKLLTIATGTIAPLPVTAVRRYHDFSFGAKWSPDSKLFLIERLSADYHVREVLVFEPASKSSWSVFTEEDKAWIGGPLTRAAFNADATQVILTSERDGFNHLYRVSARGGAAEQLTRGNFEVSWFTIPTGSSTVYFSSNEGDPAERHLYALDLGSGARTKLPTSPGWNEDFTLCEDGSHLVFSHAELGVPEDLFALALAPGASPVRLSSTVPSDLGELKLPPPEIVTYDSGGTRVHALLYRPEPPSSVNGAAVVFVHGAGYLQNVTRSMTEYPQNMLFHHRLARLGYFVIDADYRHSAGYGRDHRTAIYKFMGGKDLDDLVAAIPYLASQGVDPQRVGLYGGSYGGFLTLMALFTKPDVFACGAALRSVTDWRSYHAGYTNPRLGNPKEDAEAYKRSSPIDWAEGLQKPLLLLHGMKDGNVFAQDTIRLMEKLIKLGKDFDAMLYPSQDHGFDDPASWIDEYKRIERLFERNLRRASGAAPVTPKAEVAPGG
jgi:dipeptidyl aminopeptidase/acylaminoacyl peptidase